jgi:hypothetical protein
MRTFTILPLLILFYTASAQRYDTTKFIDNNPKLTQDESAWLNQVIQTGEFNFDNKRIAFVHVVSGGFYGIGKYTWRTKKRDFFRMFFLPLYTYTLYPLTAEEKKMTNGYDAVLLFADKNKGKLKRVKRNYVIGEQYNGYPEFPREAGLDDNPVLSTANAIFFNEVYKHVTYAPASFDFTGKKIAIFDTQCQRKNKPQRKSIPEYVARARKQLETEAFCYTDYVHILTEQQKKESGGYDVIIQYRCKMDWPVNSLLEELKKDSK